MTTDVTMALRDAAWYDQPNVNYPSVYHVVIDGHPACNSRALVAEFTTIEASLTSAASRCRRPACRNRWKDIASVPDAAFWRRLWAQRESIQRASMRAAGIHDYD